MTKRMKTSARGRRVYRRLFGCAAPRMLTGVRAEEVTRYVTALSELERRARRRAYTARLGWGVPFARLAQAIEHEVDSIEEWMTPFQRAAGYA